MDDFQDAKNKIEFERILKNHMVIEKWQDLRTRKYAEVEPGMFMVMFVIEDTTDLYGETALVYCCIMRQTFENVMVVGPII